MIQLKANKLPTFLLITDSPVTRVFFEETVDTLKDHALLCSSSAIDALDALKKTYISFIIIDENTPYIDLADICLKIRKLNDHQNTPILIITAHLKKSFTRRLLKAGATDFLREPLERNDFLHRMEMATEVKKTEQKMSTLATRFPSVILEHASLQDRSILDNRAVKLISIALEKKTSLALLLLEIDQYKQFHHAQGAKAAKGLLIDFQDHLQPLMRGHDLLFPQKNGQFVVLLPKTSDKAAQFIAENIQETLDMDTFSSGNIRFNLTVSIGLVTLEKEGENTKTASFNFDRLMQAAATCLSEATKIGNTIISHAKQKGSS